ncbi:MAG: DUF4145 domain-containing protein [Vulcanimicrobiota bacterium]
MFKLPDSSIYQWMHTKDQQYRLPQSISTICPYCDQLGIFFIPEYQPTTRRTTFYAGGAVCPACKKLPEFIVISPSLVSESKNTAPEAIFIHPDPKPLRKQIEGIELIPEQLAKAYSSVIDAYNAKIWSATATCCRRALEGLAKMKLKPGSGNLSLYAALEKLPQDIDLTEPLKKLSHAIREGGNLGAHFDEQHEPDEETVKMMLELLEYLFDYMYILPEKIEELAKRVSPSATSIATSAPSPTP